METRGAPPAIGPNNNFDLGLSVRNVFFGVCFVALQPIITPYLHNLCANVKICKPAIPIQQDTLVNFWLEPDVLAPSPSRTLRYTLTEPAADDPPRPEDLFLQHLARLSAIFALWLSLIFSGALVILRRISCRRKFETQALPKIHAVDFVYGPSDLILNDNNNSEVFICPSESDLSIHVNGTQVATIISNLLSLVITRTLSSLKTGLCSALHYLIALLAELATLALRSGLNEFYGLIPCPLLLSSTFFLVYASILWFSSLSLPLEEPSISTRSHSIKVINTTVDHMLFEQDDQDDVEDSVNNDIDSSGKTFFYLKEGEKMSGQPSLIQAVKDDPNVNLGELFGDAQERNEAFDLQLKHANETAAMVLGKTRSSCLVYEQPSPSTSQQLVPDTRRIVRDNYGANFKTPDSEIPEASDNVDDPQLPASEGLDDLMSVAPSVEVEFSGRAESVNILALDRDLLPTSADVVGFVQRESAGDDSDTRDEQYESANPSDLSPPTYVFGSRIGQCSSSVDSTTKPNTTIEEEKSKFIANYQFTFKVSDFPGIHNPQYREVDEAVTQDNDDETQLSTPCSEIPEASDEPHPLASGGLDDLISIAPSVEVEFSGRAEPTITPSPIVESLSTYDTTAEPIDGPDVFDNPTPRVSTAPEIPNPGDRVQSSDLPESLHSAISNLHPKVENDANPTSTVPSSLERQEATHHLNRTNNQRRRCSEPEVNWAAIAAENNAHNNDLEPLDRAVSQRRRCSEGPEVNWAAAAAENEAQDGKSVRKGKHRKAIPKKTPKGDAPPRKRDANLDEQQVDWAAEAAKTLSPSVSINAVASGSLHQWGINGGIHGVPSDVSNTLAIGPSPPLTTGLNDSIHAPSTPIPFPILRSPFFDWDLSDSFDEVPSPAVSHRNTSGRSFNSHTPPFDYHLSLDERNNFFSESPSREPAALRVETKQDIFSAVRSDLDRPTLYFPRVQPLKWFKSERTRRRSNSISALPGPSISRKGASAEMFPPLTYHTMTPNLKRTRVRKRGGASAKANKAASEAMKISQKERKNANNQVEVPGQPARKKTRRQPHRAELRQRLRDAKQRGDDLAAVYAAFGKTPPPSLVTSS